MNTLARSLYRSLFVALAVLTLMAQPLQAALIVTAGTVSAGAGTTGNVLQVTLTNTGPSTVTVGAFSFGVSTANAGITFTAATINTASPYVFAGHSFIVPTFSPTIDLTTGTSLLASDLYDVFGSGATLASGATVGLGRLLFNVAPGTPNGVNGVTVAAFSATSLSDALGNDLAFTTANGSITVTGAVTAVPEPATLVVFALVGAAGWVVRRRRAAPIANPS